MTDSAGHLDVAYHVVEPDLPADSAIKNDWTRDPLYSCSGHEEGGTCLVHSPEGISVALGRPVENPADWTPPDEGTVRRVMSHIAFKWLDKQLSTLLDLYDIKEKEHRTSISNSVFARKDEDGWPFMIDGKPFSPDLFKFFQERAEAAMTSEVCADVTLVPFWGDYKTIFHPMVHLVLREGPISAGEGGYETMAVQFLSPASASDSARLPYNSDRPKTPRGVYELHYIGTDGPTPSKPTPIDQRTQDVVSERVMGHKETKYSEL